MTAVTQKPDTPGGALAYGRSRALCKRCEMPFHHELLLPDGYCQNCRLERGREKQAVKRERALSARERFFNRLSDTISRVESVKEDSMVAQIFKRVLAHQEIKGIAGLSEQLAEFLAKLRESPSLHAQLKGWTLLLRMATKHDELMRSAAPDLSNLSIEDLRATLVGLAVETLEDDRDLQDAILPEFFARRPDVLARMGYAKVSDQPLEVGGVA